MAWRSAPVPPGKCPPGKCQTLRIGSAGTRQRPSSAPLHQPSPSTLPLSCLYAHAIFVSQTLLSISKDRSYHGLLAEGRTDVPTMQRSVVRMLLG
jgi:hypothetical protein